MENMVGKYAEEQIPMTTLAAHKIKIEWIEPDKMVAILHAAKNPASKFFLFFLSMVLPMSIPDAWKRLSIEEMNPKYRSNWG